MSEQQEQPGTDSTAEDGPPVITCSGGVTGSAPAAGVPGGD